jgi:hypothetical protein
VGSLPWSCRNARDAAKSCIEAFEIAIGSEQDRASDGGGGRDPGVVVRQVPATVPIRGSDLRVALEHVAAIDISTMTSSARAARRASIRSAPHLRCFAIPKVSPTATTEIRGRSIHWLSP